MQQSKLGLFQEYPVGKIPPSLTSNLFKLLVGLRCIFYHQDSTLGFGQENWTDIQRQCPFQFRSLSLSISFSLTYLTTNKNNKRLCRKYNFYQQILDEVIFYNSGMMYNDKKFLFICTFKTRGKLTGTHPGGIQCHCL